MPALPEYLTRTLLENYGVPVVDGFFVKTGDDLQGKLPELPIFLKAQIPGATSRKKHGLVRKIETIPEFHSNLDELLSPGDWGHSDGVLVVKGLNLKAEYYAGCMLDFGSEKQLPGGILLFSTEGGSGVEGRSGTLVKIQFSLLTPIDTEDIAKELGVIDTLENPEIVASFLKGLISTFIGYRLTVLEVNPIGVLSNGSLTAVDCRAE